MDLHERKNMLGVPVPSIYSETTVVNFVGSCWFMEVDFLM